MVPDSGVSREHAPFTAPQRSTLGTQLSDFRVIWQVIDSYYPHLSPDDGEPVEKRVAFHLDQLRASFPNIHEVRGKRILDIACGSRNYQDDTLKRYEPWMCRLLHHLGAIPVGVDLAPQRDENFESHVADLTVPNALRFLDPHSFDAAYISAFPTRKAIRHLDSKGLKWSDMREDILSHMRRSLKPGGIIIRQFNAGDEELVRNTLKEPPTRQSVQPSAQELPHTMPPWCFRDEDIWL